MYKTCSRCGKIHDTRYKCSIGRYTGRQSEEYKLRNTYDWQQKSIEIRDKANWMCEVCRDRDNRYEYNNLEVHHIVKLKDAPGLLLDNYNLVCLCASCHKKADRGEIDVEYLRKLAKNREDGNTPLPSRTADLENF